MFGFQAIKIQKDIESKLQAVEGLNKEIISLSSSRNLLLSELSELKLNKEREEKELSGKISDLNSRIGKMLDSMANVESEHSRRMKEKTQICNDLDSHIVEKNIKIKDLENAIKLMDGHHAELKNNINALSDYQKVKESEKKKIDKEIDRMNDVLLSISEGIKKGEVELKKILKDISDQKKKKEKLIFDIGDISKRDKKLSKRESACTSMEKELQKKHQLFLKDYVANNSKTTTDRR